MRKVFTYASLLLLLGAFWVFYLSFTHKSPEIEDSPEVLSDETTNGILDIGEYRFAWFEALGDNVTLIPNFESKKAASTLIQENNCELGINGGFYHSDNPTVNTPIGLFISEGTELSAYHSNSLFNGIFSINRFDTPRITFDVPQDPLVSALQSGPVIVENDTYYDYSQETDKNSRRMIVAITGDNKVIFAAVYNKSAVFGGPKLANLPEILKGFEDQTGINIADAMNLDGGSASAFYSRSTRLTEISPIGSLFCIKK